MWYTKSADGHRVIDGRLIAFAGLALVLVLTPGANIMLVIRSTLAGGPHAGIAAALGVALGHFVHASASALGLSLLLRTSDVAFTVMKAIGAVYLAYLGLRSFATAWHGRGQAFDVVEGEKTEVGEVAGSQRSRRFLLDGLLCNVLNPKVALFYLALLPQFIAHGEPVLTRSLLLAGVHGCISVSWQALVSLALGRLRPLLARPAVYRTLEAMTGSLLIGFGVRLALATR